MLIKRITENENVTKHGVWVMLIIEALTVKWYHFKNSQSDEKALWAWALMALINVRYD